MDREKMELIVMDIIVNSGDCRSCAMEAIGYAREGEFDRAEEAIDRANEAILKAHHVQTDLIQKEVAGEKTEISMLLIHCQDQLMTSMLCKDMAIEFLNMYKKFSDK
jgi:Phosphotransferase system cellobiose-specific component IIA